MALWLRKVLRKNPQDMTQAKWYLTQERSGSVGLQAIAKEIEGRSALSLGDVQSVLSNLVEVLPTFLKLGQSRVWLVPCFGFQRRHGNAGRTERPPRQRSQARFPAKHRP
jgi:hypothetical protein